jgi:hypothetical protein
MKLLPTILFGFAFSALAANTLTPSEVLARIQRQGGYKVLWDLWEHMGEFETLLSGIESADPAWLKVAVLLRPFSDAGASEGLDNAVALALPKSPERILSLVGNGFNLELICTSPFFEPEKPGIAEAYERKTLIALSSVHEPRLKVLANECSKRVKLSAPRA